MVVVVGILSDRCGAIAAILRRLDALLAGILPSGWGRSGHGLQSACSAAAATSPLSWPLLGGVAHAVDAPGRIHFTAFKGAVVLYLNAATIFAAAFSLIWELNPGAFASLQPRQ